jgi:threonine dehydrogenase-like Zn-dependent dehydrogenase
MSARAFWIVGRERGELLDESLPVPEEGQVLVEALASGVSRGTELLVFRGKVPPSEYERMRAPHQAGRFPWPVKYGYSSVGVVSRGPAELLHKAVFCLHPHQTEYVVPRDAVTPVPESVPPERAILAANLETALNAVWDGELRAGDRVSVVGAGVVGLLVAYLAARHPGTEVQVVDVAPEKARVAGAIGASFSDPGSARGNADLVVHASGTPEGLTTALSLAGREATVVELSWYGDRVVPLPLGEAFHARRLRIQSSQVGELPARQRARWTHRRRLETALRLLADPVLDVLVSGETGFDELPRLFSTLSEETVPSLCHRVRYTRA